MSAETIELERLRREAAPLLAKHPEIAAAYVFGSVAQGRARVGSDLDIGVVYRARGEPAHERVATTLARELSHLTGVEAVDVVDLEAQGPLFCHRVLCDGLRLYEGDADRRVDFESDTVVRALDFRPTYEIATRGKVAALRRWLKERYDLGSAADEARHPEVEPRQAR
jgi:predicted nucleotidyltransferase